MPALNFQKHLAQPILARTKLFTLRELRKDGRDPRAGQMLFLFTGQRSKQCKKIAEKRCRFSAMVALRSGRIEIPGFQPLVEATQLETFSKADGFEDYRAFCQFHKIQTSKTVRELWLIAWITRDELKALLELK